MHMQAILVDWVQITNEEFAEVSDVCEPKSKF